MRASKKALSDRELRAIAPPAKGYSRRLAGGVPGLIYRVHSSGARAFVLRFRTKAGVLREEPIGAHGAKLPAFTAERARERAAKLLAAVTLGGDPFADRAAARAAAAEVRTREAEASARRRAKARGEALPGSFAELARLYLRDPARAEAQRAESRRAYVATVELELVKAWGDRPASEITRGDVYALGAAIAAGEGVRRRRPGRPAPVAAANAIRLASTIFNFGLDVGFPGLIGNPCARVIRRLAPPRAPRDRWLSPAEIRALWEATSAEPVVPRAFARLLLLTALRRDELLSARWSQLETDERGTWLAIPAERMKSAQAHRVPLSSLALVELAVLGETRAADGIFLFPGRSRGTHLREVFYFRRRLSARMAPMLAGEATDPRGWTWHDLRRTARSILAAEGVSDTVAELLLAHVPATLRGSAGTYNRHSYAGEKVAAVEALARRVRAIVTGEAGNVLPFYQRDATSP